jgi:hypothetical protein
MTPAARFEQVAAILRDLDIDRVSIEATEAERKVIVEELVEVVALYADHQEVTVAGPVAQLGRRSTNLPPATAVG